jgi:hypothetical protein
MVCGSFQGNELAQNEARRRSEHYTQLLTSEIAGNSTEHDKCSSNCIVQSMNLLNSKVVAHMNIYQNNNNNNSDNKSQRLSCRPPMPVIQRLA